ncbi:MAG: ABC transporter substrate-binding protein [Rhodocyclaceae bacterium]|nr:MAG: ABC transporter substrate-binding protein [Rhodocyclaceae bacterium]
MKNKYLLMVIFLFVFSASRFCYADDGVVKVGLILSMTGPFASTGKQLEQGARLFLSQHGLTAGGKRIELIVKDDGGQPEQARLLAQELIIKEKVEVLGGFTLTPIALATAPFITQSKTPSVVFVAAAAGVINASPYFVRTSFSLPHVTSGIADWAPRNGIKKVVSLVSDYGPGIDAETTFKQVFEQEGGKVTDQIRVPIKNPDFGPFVQKVRDEKPDAVFVFLPAGAGIQFMKQYAERGLAQLGIKLIATGDVTEDDIVNDLGGSAIGAITSHHYSAAHPSKLNQKFVESFKKMFDGKRPNYMAVAAYDGMKVICDGLDITKGMTGEVLLGVMKNMSFESPRGNVSINPKTRDIAQDTYIRRVEKKGAEYYNVEFETIKNK